MSKVDIDHFASNIKDVNPYHVGLHAKVDTELFNEPMLEMDPCDLNWSILSTHVKYTIHRDLDSPYKDMNTSSMTDWEMMTFWSMGLLKSVMKGLKRCHVA